MPKTRTNTANISGKAKLIAFAITFVLAGSASASSAKPAAQTSAGPVYKPCAPAAGSAVTSGPCTGKADDLIWLRVEKALEISPALIVFRQAIEGTPATSFRIPFPRGELQAGTLYSLKVPARLCTGAGKPWDMQLIGSDGKPMGTIGHFTAECEVAKAG